MVDGQVYKVGFIIQARMKSERLPNKVLSKLPLNSERTILDWIIDEISKLDGKIVVATSEDASNNPIRFFCSSKGVECFMGSESDVLSRFLEIQQANKFDYLIRLTGDNPFIDSEIIKRVLNLHIEKELDYTCSSNLPLGINVEVMTGSSLMRASRYITRDCEREHVTVILRENNIFKSYTLDFDHYLKDLRVTVDTFEDYIVASTIASLSKKAGLSGVRLIEDVYRHYPCVFKLNKGVFQKQVFLSPKKELDSAILLLQRNDFLYTANILKDKSNEIS